MDPLLEINWFKCNCYTHAATASELSHFLCQPIGFHSLYSIIKWWYLSIVKIFFQFSYKNAYSALLLPRLDTLAIV